MATAAPEVRRQRAPRRVVLAFDDGSAETRTSAVRGGKGANLADMVALGLPVPPGFTVTTTVGRAFIQHGSFPRRLHGQIVREMRRLEELTGKGFGDTDNPLLVSVRSGAPVSMPGMMDTLLNVGLNRQTVRALADMIGARAAWDSYRRFLAQYAQLVYEMPSSRLERIVTGVKQDAGVVDDHELSVRALRRICYRQREAITAWTRENNARFAALDDYQVPEDPERQLEMAIVAVLESWESVRAQAYRDAHGIPSLMGTAITVQAMVFGNRSDSSGTGVVFSHDVNTGQPGLYGEFLPNAQGEDVVAGIRTPRPISEMADWAPGIYRELERHVATLADRIGDMVDVEFTIEEGVLHLLQVRRALRAPLASVVSAVREQWAGRMSHEEAVASVSDSSIKALMRKTFDTAALQGVDRSRLCATGIAASPGAAVGTVVFSSEEAVRLSGNGQSVILVRTDTSPDDLPGMLKAAAIVTKNGGATSHAAVVARGLGLPAVVGVKWHHALPYLHGKTVSVDGDTGNVYLGEIPLVTPQLPKEANIFLRWRQRFRTRRVTFDTAGLRQDASQLLAEFYLSDAMAASAAGTSLANEAQTLRDQTHRRIADCFADYLALAVGGEVRHVRDPEHYPDLEMRFGVRVGHHDRYLAQQSVMSCLRTVSGEVQREFLAVAATAFSEGYWGALYGGKAWAKIAKAALMYLAGELTPSLFVDHVFDLEHNRGRLFDKHPMFAVRTNDAQVRVLLDFKKHTRSIVALQDGLKSHLHEASPVSELWRRGKALRVWH